MDKLMRLIGAPANWCGLGLASVVLVLQALGLLGTLGLGVAAVGYVAGFVVGGLWLGFPWTRAPEWEMLEFKDEGDAREAMERALDGVRQADRVQPREQDPGQPAGACARPVQGTRTGCCSNGNGPRARCRCRTVSMPATSQSATCPTR